MRLVIVYLSGGGLSGGGRNTLRALVPRLQGDERVSRLDVFVPPQAVSLPEVRPLSPRTWAAGDRLMGWRGLRAQIRELKSDVIFIPNAAWFNAGEIPTVCMLRNMEAVLAPFGDNPLGVGLKNLLRSRIARRAFRKATRVIAVSQFVRDFLVNRWGLPERKIGVVYHGVDSAVPVDQMHPPESLGDGEVAPFWFTAGSLLPYRGLEDMIRALAVRIRRGVEENLLIAGAPVYSEAYKSSMQKLAQTCGVADRIRWVGYLHRREMAWCFRKGLGFVMTSRLEACPNLALEAMSYGSVSIATTCPPFPEVFGEAAIYYRPGDSDELAAKLEQLHQMSGEDRDRHRGAALARAETFSWAVAADRTIGQLQAAIETKSET